MKRKKINDNENADSEDETIKKINVIYSVQFIVIAVHMPGSLVLYKPVHCICASQVMSPIWVL